MSRTIALSLAVSSLVVATAACGGGDKSISDFNNSDNNAGGTLGGSNGSGPGTGLGTNGPPAPGGDLSACATQTATAEAKPVYLVFMFDKSGSMVDNGSPKWASSTAATKSFFESVDSKGISASLSFFPDRENYSCNTSAYSTPQVAMAALPSTDFANTLDSQVPGGGTPTYQAMQGAISYAQGIASGLGSDGSTAIVLVTDGLPEAECSNTSVSKVKALAASVSTSIPTYVIGVGDALSNLNDIAVGGGTTSALIVSPTNAAQLQTDFAKAINQIKNSALTCDYKIPAAPTGETFDRSKVNLQYTAPGAAAATLDYNQGCTGGAGWKYDDATNPTRVLLCDTSCTGVKTTSGKVDILFGCATQGAPVK